MTAGSGAKILLAYSDAATQQAVLPTAKFTDRALAEVRKRGWAQSVAEREPGVASVSAPVRDGRGTGDRGGIGVRTDRSDGTPAGSPMGGGPAGGGRRADPPAVIGCGPQAQSPRTRERAPASLGSLAVCPMVTSVRTYEQRVASHMGGQRSEHATNVSQMHEGRRRVIAAVIIEGRSRICRGGARVRGFTKLDLKASGQALRDDRGRGLRSSHARRRPHTSPNRLPESTNRPDHHAARRPREQRPTTTARTRSPGTCNTTTG